VLIAAWRRGVCPTAMLVTTDHVSPQSLATVFRVHRLHCDVSDDSSGNRHSVDLWIEFSFFSVFVFNVFL
jgi:hypothetical protein